MEYIIGIFLGILIVVIGLLIFNALRKFGYPRWLKWIFNLKDFRLQRKAGTDETNTANTNIGEELIELEDPIESPGLIPQGVLACVGTILLVSLLGFLYFFYAGVLEKAFAPEFVPKKKQEINHFFDFTAVPRAFRAENPEQFPNYPVILFPSVFFVFAYVAHFFFHKVIKMVKRFGWFLAITIVLLGGFDFILAKKIAHNLSQAFDFRKALVTGASSEISKLMESGVSEGLNILGIIFLGFISSLLLGVGLYCNLQDWGKVSLLHKKIKTE